MNEPASTSGMIVEQLELHNEDFRAPRGLAFIPGEERLLVAYLALEGREKTSVVSLLETQTGTTSNLEINVGIINGFHIHPFLPLVLIHGYEGAELIDLNQLKILRKIVGFEVGCVAFTPDGQRAIISETGRRIWTLDLENFDLTENCDIDDKTICICFNRQFDLIAITGSSQEGSGTFFAKYEDDLVTQSGFEELFYFNEGVSAAFSPDGRHFVHVDRVVRLFSFPSMNEKAIFDTHGEKICLQFDDNYFAERDDGSSWSNPVFTRDSKKLICESPNGCLYVWDLNDLNLVMKSRGHGEGRRFLDLNSNGDLLASFGDDNRVIIRKMNF